MAFQPANPTTHHTSSSTDKYIDKLSKYPSHTGALAEINIYIYTFNSFSKVLRMCKRCQYHCLSENKYLSIENKLPHTCKDHLQVTTKTVKNSQNEAIRSFLAQMKQFYLVLGQKYQF